MVGYVSPVLRATTISPSLCLQLHLSLSPPLCESLCFFFVSLCAYPGLDSSFPPPPNFRCLRHAHPYPTVFIFFRCSCLRPHTSRAPILPPHARPMCVSAALGRAKRRVLPFQHLVAVRGTPVAELPKNSSLQRGKGRPRACERKIGTSSLDGKPTVLLLAATQEILNSLLSSYL